MVPKQGDPEEGTGTGWGWLPSPARRAASRGGRPAPCRPAAARCGCSLARRSAEAGGSHPGQTPARCPRAARGDAEARGKQSKRLPGSLARGMETNCSGHSPVPSQQSGFPGRKGPWRAPSQHVPPQHQRCRGWILPGLRPLVLNGRGSGAGIYGARESKSLAWALFGAGDSVLVGDCLCCCGRAQKLET